MVVWFWHELACNIKNIIATEMLKRSLKEKELF